MSRFDYFEHIDGPQGRIDASGRMLPGKGGGGGGGAAWYDGQENLLQEQARAARFMLDESMPYIPVTMQRTDQMVNDAFSGALADRARNTANADAQQSMGMGLAAANRNTARYGAEFNPTKMMYANRDAALQGAALRSDGMNKAGQWAEDQKWNRNAGQFAQATGMGSGAMSGISSAASGMGQIASAQNQGAMANAQGYGAFGGAMAGGMLGQTQQKADGGMVKKGLRYASGGSVNAWERYKAANPLQANKRQKGGGTKEALGMIAMGAAPHLLGAGIRDVVNNGTNGVIGKGLKSAADYFKGPQQAADPAQFGARIGEVDAAFGPVQTSGLSNLNASVPADTMKFGMAGDAASMAETPVADFTSTGAGVATQALQDELAQQAAAETAALSWYADGGPVQQRGLRYALGGQVRMPQTRMPGLASMDASSSMRVNHNPGAMKISRPISAPMAPAAPQQGGVTLGDGINATKKVANAGGAAMDAADASKNATDAVEAARVANETIDTVDQADKALDAASAATDAIDTADKASSALDGAAGGNPVGSVVGALGKIAAGEDAGTAVADAAASYGGAELGATIGSAVGPVGTVVGGLLGGLLGGSIFKDGGDVQGRADYRPGGDVQGPGTETSDDIPAWLSDGEFVNNAESVKLPAGETKRVVQEWQREGGSTRELLEEINNAGLQRRYGSSGKLVRPQAGLAMLANGGCAKKGPKLAGGGYLGVALGAGTQEYNRQQRMAQEQERFDQQKAMQERQMQMSEAQAKRQEEQYQTQKNDKVLVESVQRGAAENLADAEAIASFDSSHMTPAEKAAAAQAYRSSGYSPETLRNKATNAVSGLDLVKGLSLANTLDTQERSRRASAAQQALASGDTAGAVANAGGDWTTQGAGLSLLSRKVNPKTGAAVLEIGKNGQPVASIDERLVGDFLTTTLDPTKLNAYSSAQRTLANQDIDNKRADAQLALSGGHLGLAQQKWAQELGDIKTKREYEGKVRDIRVKLSEASDPAEIEKYKFQLQALSGSDKGDQYRYEIKQYEDDSGRKRLARVDRNAGSVEQVNPEPKAKPAGQTKGISTIGSKAEFDALPSGAKFQIVENGKVVKSGTKP